jgi:hypothetical protein
VWLPTPFESEGRNNASALGAVQEVKAEIMAALASIWAVPIEDVQIGRAATKPTMRSSGDCLTVGRASLPLVPRPPSTAPQVSFLP